MTNNIAIAYDTRIDKAVGGNGDDTFIVNNDGDTINGGAGTNTVVFAGSSTQYTIANSSRKCKCDRQHCWAEWN